ncbi:hypothetical protein B0J12DRAFT_684991 [Macrophomina phaseolina]|uniref:Uncharacterized protein n=1 Tax=Macrophomina phaseolina TaxID=35725 RepID=A0ABQ8FWM4_9PEZI|nr:hypothetical protein B0J12DRAFT_684991 [Macrophomina phaseolina]
MSIYNFSFKRCFLSLQTRFYFLRLRFPLLTPTTCLGDQFAFTFHCTNCLPSRLQTLVIQRGAARRGALWWLPLAHCCSNVCAFCTVCAATLLLMADNRDMARAV